MVLMPDGFPIAPRWIPPTRPACLTATECLKASDSAENASVLPSRWNDGMWHGIRWVRWGGRGDELRLRGVVIQSPGTDPTLATGGGRLSSVPRHRSRVVGHSPDEGQHHSSAACSHDWRPSLWHGGRCAPCHCEGLQSWLQAQRERCCPAISKMGLSEVKIRTRFSLSQA